MEAMRERPQILTPVAELRPATLELLAWIADGPRSYAEAMDAWRSSCPRLTVWEDALEDGLVRIVRNGAPGGRSSVALTARGWAALGSR
jgi:hypothetical protein